MHKTLAFNVEQQNISIALGMDKLEGELIIPTGAEGLVIVGSNTSHIKYSPRQNYFTYLLRQGDLATIHINLLTEDEATIDRRTKHYERDINHLASRFLAVTDWVTTNPLTSHLKVGYFGMNASAGAALLAATERPTTIRAVVSQSGQTDLVNRALSYIQTPTLLIVGGDDYPTMTMNEDALAQITVPEKRLEVIPKATHQFQEAGALEEAARLARQWFKHFLSFSRN
ncbi:MULTISPECIES: dienelactone hydrolase family protein [Nostocales]|uniref:Alpha/beta hydrolase n=2 Tax=Nostocales TaxID=1161 RepID=A0A0C1ND81_9CYAN|nr:alpha/beta hydrolase [Tolypothrix bouteillei]KAF3886705.1 alpha/beta hydrolase [Tolypothrix bouteillei VB521301]